MIVACSHILQTKLRATYFKLNIASSVFNSPAPVCPPSSSSLPLQALLFLSHGSTGLLFSISPFQLNFSPLTSPVLFFSLAFVIQIPSFQLSTLISVIQLFFKSPLPFLKLNSFSLFSSSSSKSSTLAPGFPAT